MATGDKLRDINPQDCFVTNAAGAIVGVQAGADISTAARFLNEAQVTALAAAPLAQAGSTVAVLNASKTALRDPAGGADISLGGGVGAPGGSNTQLQYNNAGAFGGIPTLAYDSASNGLIKTMDNAGGGGGLFKTASVLNAASPGYSHQWREGVFTTPFTYTDFVQNAGYNWLGSSRENTAFPAQFIQLEAAYQLNNSALAAMKVTEMHWNHVSVDGRLRRPFVFVGAWDGEFINVNLSGSRTAISDLAANDRIVGDYLNGETTLNGAISSAVTSIVLTKARTVSNGEYLTIVAEGANTSETVLVTAGGGTTTLTVTRAQSSTAASAHASGAVVLLASASLNIYSAAYIRSDASTPFLISNATGTFNWFVLNSAGSALATALAIAAPTQSMLYLKNTSASGAVALLMQANNGAKVSQITLYGNGDFELSANGQGGAVYLDLGATGLRVRNNAYSTVMHMNASNQLGIGTSAQSAVLHIKAGIATAGQAPLKLTSGTNLTTAENGAMEYNGTNLFFTRAGAVREGVITQSAVTTEAGLVMDTSVTVNIGGASYKLMARAV